MPDNWPQHLKGDNGEALLFRNRINNVSFLVGLKDRAEVESLKIQEEGALKAKTNKIDSGGM